MARRSAERYAGHEQISGHSEVRAGSDRGFGCVVAAVLAAVGLWPLLSDASPSWWFIGASAGVLAVAFAAPRLLAPLNRLWFRFGLRLHAVVTPVVLGIVFFGAVTPTALLMRLFGKDPLGLRVDRRAASYWLRRVPPGPPSDSLKNQF
jgi:hypothetical protein